MPADRSCNRKTWFGAANHILFDVPSARLAPDTFAWHFARTDSILRAFGAEPVWFRPGSGRFNDHMLALLCEAGSVGVLGDVYPSDAAIPSAGFAVDFITHRARPGFIIIMHDGKGRERRTGPSARARAAEFAARGSPRGDSDRADARDRCSSATERRVR